VVGDWSTSCGSRSEGGRTRERPMSRHRQRGRASASEERGATHVKTNAKRSEPCQNTRKASHVCLERANAGHAGYLRCLRRFGLCSLQPLTVSPRFHPSGSLDAIHVLNVSRYMVDVLCAIERIASCLRSAYIPPSLCLSNSMFLCVSKRVCVLLRGKR
jgi:hypothetical protein